MDHGDARAREEREHLRLLLEEGAAALRGAYTGFKSAGTFEESLEALRPLGAVNGRLVERLDRLIALAEEQAD